MTRGPTIVRVAPGSGGGKGIKCCCCRCCECINFGYLTSQHGVIKLAQAMLGGLCQSLLVKYGLSEASSMGSAFHGFLTTASACLLTTALLITCYVLSSNSQHLIRQSIFETVFNAVACFMYLSASSYMGVAVNIYLYPRYALVNMYAAYPAMTAVYLLSALSFFASGSDGRLCGRNINSFMSQPSASRCLHEVVEALNHPSIVKKYIHFPQNFQERNKLKERFFEKYKIPGVIGCIDGTYVAMVRPSENEERFYCRKGNHARNVLLYIGVIVGILHGVDAYLSYKYHKGLR